MTIDELMIRSPSTYANRCRWIFFIDHYHCSDMTYNISHNFTTWVNKSIDITVFTIFYLNIWIQTNRFLGSQNLIISWLFELEIQSSIWIQILTIQLINSFYWFFSIWARKWRHPCLQLRFPTNRVKLDIKK